MYCSLSFVQRKRRDVIKNEFLLCHNIFNSIILEKEITITTQFQMFVRYLPIPPTICGLFQE